MLCLNTLSLGYCAGNNCVDVPFVHIILSHIIWFRCNIMLYKPMLQHAVEFPLSLVSFLCLTYRQFGQTHLPVTLMAEDMSSLLSLVAELACSVCLRAFENPITLPCGHNFCQSCLEESWKETFLLFCPQCRYHYPSKPELKKNTALSAVVETFKKKSSTPHLNYVGLSVCLTCMASFCEEQVKPYLVNPMFRPHQLTDPHGELHGQICQDHHKIMEFFCKKHECCICAACRQQLHRGCEYTTTEDIRAQKEVCQLIQTIKNGLRLVVLIERVTYAFITSRVTCTCKAT